VVLLYFLSGSILLIEMLVGNFNYANLVSWSNTATFASKALTSYTVGGKAGGLFKTVSNLSWLQVYEAGHEVPFYQPALALQAFKQIMSGEGLKST
jgi:carboxypeptidase C (cathepsin A)